MKEKITNISRKDFDAAIEAIWTEISYQDGMDKRTTDEAQDVPGFLTLGRRYERKVEDAWADNPSDKDTGQVEEALHGLRKLAAIYVRAMVYNGVRNR